MTGHSLTLHEDDGGWDYATCDCGWSCDPVPGADIASEMWADHLLAETSAATRQAIDAALREDGR